MFKKFLVVFLLFFSFGLCQKLAPMDQDYYKDKSYTGIWDSTFGEILLIQQDDIVHGEYKTSYGEGFLKGEIEGRVLFFDWVEDGKDGEMMGKGHFIIQPGGKVIKGGYGYSDFDSAGEWNSTYKRDITDEDLN